MPLGIEKLDLYAGRLSLDVAELAVARGRDAGAAANLMCESRSVYAPYEDAVTLAVNAARRVLSPEDLAEVALLVVGTESGVDFGKPIATWVHRFAGLSPQCRTLEVKHACYGATGALRLALAWLASEAPPGKKALVVSTDVSRCHLGSPAELICGGCAVAMLVGPDAQVLAIEPRATGYWTHEISDTFRPTATAEVGNNQLSLCSYMDALEGAYAHFTAVVGPHDYDAAFAKHVYHAPFPAMALRAHRSMLGRTGAVPRGVSDESFRRKVRDGLCLAARIGSQYGASTFVCLLGLLAAAPDLEPGDRVSLFAYGSGCQGEFYAGSIGASAVAATRDRDPALQLDQRMAVSVAEYEACERAREQQADGRSFEPARGAEFDEAFAGSGLLVLKRVADYRREYEWS